MNSRSFGRTDPLVPEPGFLFNERKAKAKYHLWDGHDTACRMWSTGGMNTRRAGYTVVETPPDRELCHMCRQAGESSLRDLSRLSEEMGEEL